MMLRYIGAVLLFLFFGSGAWGATADGAPEGVRENGAALSREAFDALVRAAAGGVLPAQGAPKALGGPRITGFEPIGGRMGDAVAIRGEGFAPGAADNLVFFGGAPAVIQKVSEAELSVTVPEGAVSGRISVETETGTGTSERDFLVMTEISGTFQPPAGIVPGAYVVTNSYQAAAVTGGAFRVLAPAGKISLLAAVNPETDANNNYLACVIPDVLNEAKAPAGGITIDALSTAETLVFMHPFLMTPEPVAAMRVKGIMRGLPEVQVLAAQIGQRYPNGADGLADPEIEAAWNAAVHAVIGAMPESLDLNAAAAPDAVTAGPVPGPTAYLLDEVQPGDAKDGKGFFRVKLDEDYAELNVNNDSRRISFSLSCDYSPVDFLIGIWRLDPDKMPQGVNPPYAYVKGYDFAPDNAKPYHEVVALESNQWTAKIDVLRQALDLALEGIYSVTGVSSGDPEFLLPPLDEDAVYIIRTFSGGWKDHLQSPSDDYSGLQQVPEAKALWINALGLNITLGLLDVWQLAASGEVSARRELVKAIFEQVVSEAASQIAQQDLQMIEVRDAIRIIFEISLVAGDALIEYYQEHGVESVFDSSSNWKKASAKLRKTAGQALKKATTILTVLEKVSSIGRIGERTLGLAGYITNVYGLELAPGPSPMETIFLVVGDPFSPVITGCNVAEAPPGVIVTFSGKHFHTTPEGNEVTFNAGDKTARVVSVSADGTEMAVEIPEGASGHPEFTSQRALRSVTYDGFTAVHRPVIISVTNTVVVPASPNPVGKPYAGEPGSVVDVQGVYLVPDEEISAVELYVGDTKITGPTLHTASTIQFRCPAVNLTGTGWVFPDIYLRYAIAGNWHETSRNKLMAAAPPYIEHMPETAQAGQQVQVRGLGLDAGFKVFVGGQIVDGRLLEGSRVQGVFTMPSFGADAPGAVPVEVWNPTGNAQASLIYVPGCTEPEDPQAPEITSEILVGSFSGSMSPNGTISLAEALAAAGGALNFWSNGYDDYDQEWVEKWVEAPVPETDPIEYQWEQQGYESKITTRNNRLGYENRHIYRQETNRYGQTGAPFFLRTVSLDGGSGEYATEEGDRVLHAQPGLAVRDVILAGFETLEGARATLASFQLSPFDEVWIYAPQCILTITDGNVAEAARFSFDGRLELGGTLSITGTKTRFICSGTVAGGQISVNNLHGGRVAVSRYENAADNAVSVSNASNTEISLGAVDAGGWAVAAEASDCLKLLGSAEACASGGARLVNCHDTLVGINTRQTTVGIALETSTLCRVDAVLSDCGTGIQSKGGKSNAFINCTADSCSIGAALLGAIDTEIDMNATGCTTAVMIAEGAQHNMVDVRASDCSTAIQVTGADTADNFLSADVATLLVEAVRIEEGAHENTVRLNTRGDMIGHGVRLTGAGTTKNKVIGVIGGANSRMGGRGVYIDDGAEGNTITANIDNCADGGIVVGQNVFNTQIEGCEIGTNAANGKFGIHVQDGALGTMIVNNEIDLHEMAAIYVNGLRDDADQSMAISELGLTDENGAQGCLAALWFNGCSGVYMNDIWTYGGYETGLRIEGEDSRNFTANNVRFGFMRSEGALLSHVSDSLFIGLQVDETGAASKIGPAQAGLGRNGININTCTNIRFEGLLADNNHGHGIAIWDGTGLDFADSIGAMHNAQAGFHADGVNLLTIEEIFVSSNDEHGVNLANCSNVLVRSMAAFENGQWALHLDGCHDFQLQTGQYYPPTDTGLGAIAMTQCAGVSLGSNAMKSLMFQTNNNFPAIAATATSGLEVAFADFYSDVAQVPPVVPRLSPIVTLDTVADSRLGPLVFGAGSLRFFCNGDTGRNAIEVRGNCTGLEIRQNLILSAVQAQPAAVPMKHAILFDGGASGAALVGNYILAVHDDAVKIQGGAANNLLARNRIVRNSVNGVLVDGPQTVRNRFTQNVISDNKGMGIDLINGGNNEIPAPVIQYADLSTNHIAGSVNPAPPAGARVEVYADPEDEGLELLGRSPLLGNNFSVSSRIPVNRQLHAVIIHPDGNTSEFGPVQPVGPPAEAFAFFYATEGAENDDLWLHDPRYSAPMRLTENPARDYMPAADAQQRGLVFVSERAGNADIWLMYFDGRAPVPLTTGAEPEFDPALHGDTLAFVREEGGMQRIYAGPVDFANGTGGPWTLISAPGGNDRYPCWAHDGMRLAFASDRGGDWDIWTADPNGDAPLNLTQGLTGNQSQPAYAADGRQLAFMSDGALWAMDANGANPAVMDAASGLARPKPTTISGRWLCVGPGDGATEIGLITAKGLYKTLRKGTVHLVDPEVARGAVLNRLDPETAAWMMQADSGMVNVPPVLNAPDHVSGAEGVLLMFSVSASDPNADTLVFSAMNLPPGAVFDASTGVFSWLPPAGAAGEYPDVYIIVSDDGSPARQTAQSVNIIIASTGEGEGVPEGEGNAEGGTEGEGDDEGEHEGNTEAEYEGILEGEGMGEGEGEEEPCCGCRAAEECFHGCAASVEPFRDFLNDAFIYVVSLGVLVALSRRRH